MSHVSTYGQVPLLPAYSPDGLAEMSLVALSLGIEVAFVAAHHIAKGIHRDDSGGAGLRDPQPAKMNGATHSMKRGAGEPFRFAQQREVKPLARATPQS